MSLDQLAEKAPDWTPYRYGFNNPVRYTDPTGMFEENPVYGSDGSFRGVDQHGLQGEAIICDGEFTNGMAQSEILNNGGETFSNLSNYERWQFMDKGWSHWKTLDQRPDWDGFVTIQEGIDWAKKHPGAMDNPTPDNAPYLDASKLDFGKLQASELTEGVQMNANLFNYTNFKSEKSRHTTYAIGNTQMKLLNAEKGTVKLFWDNYDWDVHPGGNQLRDTLIRGERTLKGLDVSRF